MGFTPIISAPSILSNEWDVTAEVDDPSERYSGFDVDVGDVVFINLLSSTSAPMTAGRYTITAILNRTATTVRAVLRWGGDGVGVDPVEGAGQRGYLSSPSTQNALAWQPNPRALQIEDDLVYAARNTEQFVIVDKFASSINGAIIDQTARDRQVRSVSTLRSFTLGQLVTTRGGTPDLANPQDALKMPAVAMALGMGAGAVLLQAGGVVSNPVFDFIPGLPLFVGMNGSITQNPESITRPGILQQIGVAWEKTVIDLTFDGRTLTR